MDSGLREALDSVDTCHNSDKGQFLTTIDVSCFPTYQSLRKRGQRSEDIRLWMLLKLIMMYVRRISSDHCESSDFGFIAGRQ